MKKLVLAMACLSAVGLQAQTRINGGMQVGGMIPTGDFADKKALDGEPLGANDGLGLHFGGHLDFNYTQHSQLRLHLDFMGFASKEMDIYPNGYYDGTRQNAFGITQFGADYVHNFDSPSRGGYFLAGLNFNSIKATAKYSRYPDSDVSQSGKLGLRIGGGYTFNRVISLEGHLNHVSVDKSGSDGFGYDSMTWVAVSAVFRFGR
jgi:hypothetical protein